MCSIGRDQTTSIGTSAPSSTLLGSTAVGGSLATGGATRVDRARPRGTLLTGPATTDGLKPPAYPAPRQPPKNDLADY